MDDSSEEYWEVDDNPQSYESKGKLGSIWTKGLNIGKKAVITGVVISSAPFVVPPLMALSAIGFAFSVPAGFAFVTYACSEKLMNKLLPMPSLSSSEEDEMLSISEEELDEGYEEDEDIDSDEMEVETRIELVAEDNEKIDGYDRIYVNEIVEEEPLNVSGVTDEEMTRGTTWLIEEMRDEGIYDQPKVWDISGEEETEEIEGNSDISIKMETYYDRICMDELVAEDEEKHLSLSGLDKEEMRRETTGLIEEMRDEGKYGQHDRQNIVGEETTEESEGNRETPINDVTDYGRIPVDELVEEEEENPVSVSDVNEAEMRSETTGLIEEMSDEGKYDQKDRWDIVREETMEGSEGNRGVSKDVTDYGRVPFGDIVEEDEENPVSVSGVNEKEMRSETTSLIEEMRDEGKYDQQDGQNVVGEETTFEIEGKRETLIKDVTDYGRIPIDEIVEEGEGNPVSVSGVNEEEMRSETTGLIEEMRDEGKNDRLNIVGEETTEEIEGNRDISIKDVIDFDRIPIDEVVTDDEEKLISLSGIDEEEMGTEKTGLFEETRDEGKYYQQDAQNILGEETTEEIEGKREILIEDLENKGIENELFVIPEEVRPDEDAKGMTNGFRNEETATNLSNVEANEKVREAPEENAKEGTNNGFRSEESLTNLSSARPDEVVREEGERNLVVRVKNVGKHTATDVRIESSDEKTGTLVMSDVDARETTDESGLDLVDQVIPSTDQTEDSVNEMCTGVHEVLIETTILSVSEHSGALSSQDSTAVSGELKSSEEKIWEHINAMRTIVGYKVAPRSSCLEELKALYIFTGVEPPPSSKDPDDLIDIDEKLHFLMSIVGVK